MLEIRKAQIWPLFLLRLMKSLLVASIRKFVFSLCSNIILTRSFPVKTRNAISMPHKTVACVPLNSNFRDETNDVSVAKRYLDN